MSDSILRWQPFMFGVVAGQNTIMLIHELVSSEGRWWMVAFQAATLVFCTNAARLRLKADKGAVR